MKIIDTHSHIFPSLISKKATNAISEFYSDTPMAHTADVNELLESGKKGGISKFVVFSTATTPKQVRRINDFILNESKQHDEFIPVGTMHRDFEDYEEEIERISGLGVKGIKLHPDFQQFNFDDELLYPIYELLEKKGMFVITHSGDYRYGYSNPLRVANIAKKYKKLRIVAAHCGGWSQWEIAKDCLVLPNVYVDTSSTIGFFGGEIVKRAIDVYGEEKVFFGVDFPMWDHKSEVDAVTKIVGNDNTLEKIFHKNFEDFYGEK